MTGKEGIGGCTIDKETKTKENSLLIKKRCTVNKEAILLKKGESAVGVHTDMNALGIKSCSTVLKCSGGGYT